MEDRVSDEKRPGRGGTKDADETVLDRESTTKKPPMYRVLLHNDDYTTKEFVVQIVEAVFNKDNAEAVQIMLHVHRNGVGVAGVYPFEVAETKVKTVEGLAQQYEYPLKCSVEEE